MASTLTPNMSLTVPTAGSEAGPAYAQEINSDLSILDSHNHSAGSGVQITPDGLNINAALTLNSNFIINSAGMTLIAQNSTPVNNTIYQSGLDLYFTDGVGNNVRLTQSGAVAGTPGSIANLVSPASASYVSASSTFVWQSDAGIAANMDAGSLLLRNLSPNSTFALTLSPPASLAANYAITLPALPISQKIMTLDGSGNMSAPYTVDGSTITINANVIGIPSGGISTTQLADASVTTAKIADANVTRAKLVALGQQISSSSASYSTTSTSATNITNLTVTITTTGRPVRLFCQPDGTASGAYMSAQSGTTTPQAQVNWLRGATALGVYVIRANASGATSVQQSSNSNCEYLDVIAAGTYTYKLQATCASGTTLQVNNYKIVAYET